MTSSLYGRILWIHLLCLLFIVWAGTTLQAQSPANPVIDYPVENGFTIAEDGNPVPICVSDNDFPGVIRVAGHLQRDLEKVAGTAPVLYVRSQTPFCPLMIIAGTAGKNEYIDSLIRTDVIESNLLQGRRETYVLTVIETQGETPGKALIIAGSDKRGTIYGLYELSKYIGVTPLHFWADVPVKQKRDLYMIPGIYT
ncbi:MAG: hypothetical protein PHZ01_08660, partial [Bacteroidales bacterium]|nr:hypothetical protein [Bacteroidales bacterium]